jgi:2,4-dienoyl-CoA reductase-like NADH-dependent reductase (Old Yellow Enzyme family)
MRPTTPSDSPFFTPLSLGSLTLRNRAVRAGCFEGMSPGGQVTDKLIEHHRRVAAGGVAMTTLSYCSVSYDGRAFGHELWMRPEILPGLRAFTTAIHGEGAAASVQLGHCGFFASPSVIGRRLFRMSYCAEMTESEIAQKTENFATAARLAHDAGFDAVEVHAGHGYLLSQFLSPWTNHRHDRYGGSLENRLRFPVEVVARVRRELGPGFPVLVKMNLLDGMSGGLELQESVQVAQAFEAAGATALVPSCGFTASTPLFMLRGGRPVVDMARAQKGFFYKIGLACFGWLMVQRYRFEPLFLLEAARQVRDAVSIPVAYIGGTLSMQHVDSLIGEGFAFVQLGRSLIRDPDFVNRLLTAEVEVSDCDHCNRCIAAMSADGVACLCP